MTNCCALRCKNVGIHTFPKDPAMRKKWIAALRIKNFEPTRYSRLCRDHFIENDYISSSITTGLTPIHRFLKKKAVPSIFYWNKEPVTESSIARAERCARRSRIRRDIFAFEESQDPCVLKNPESEIIIEQECESDEVTVMQESPVTVSVSIQTPTILSIFSTGSILTDNESVYYYTGLETAEKFYLVLSTLMPMAEKLKYRYKNVLNLSVEDQFLILLVKLRRAKPDFELGKMFGVSKYQVQNVLITWINFVNDIWLLIDIWPSRDLVDFYMPETFKQNKMPTRVIIDCTEIPIEKPSDPMTQQITFSSYKNTNTLKFLVGSTPGGLLTYCSEGYGGSVSDRQMIERSNLMNLCEEGDSIMADRGFNVQDLFAPRNVGINIPTFLKGKSQLPGVALLNDRKVASQRVHIERLIGLTKTFKILKMQLNSYYVPLASKIFFICLMLCNFKECIMKGSQP